MRSDDRSLADLDVVDYAHLSSQSHILAQFRAAGDPRLRRDDRVCSHGNVMRNLHEIVDLGPSADQRATKSRAIDSCIGADLDIVFDLDNTGLRDFDSMIAAPGIAEAIAADDHTRLENDPVAEAASIANHHMGMQHAVAADCNSIAQKHSWKQNAAIANLREFAYIHMGIDRYIVTKLCGRIDIRRGSDFPAIFGTRSKQLKNFGERHIGLRHL